MICVLLAQGIKNRDYLLSWNLKLRQFLFQLDNSPSIAEEVIDLQAWNTFKKYKSTYLVFLKQGWKIINQGLLKAFSINSKMYLLRTYYMLGFS